MNNKRLERFLSVFSQTVRDEILDFCKRISSTHADVYIFMARKAAAFCDCLEELGQIHLDGYVTSDRALDIDGNWLKGKTVLLIDDAVVSGTTLYNTIRKLEDFGVDSISVHILTINIRWYNPTLLEDYSGTSYVYPVFSKKPDRECIKLCNDIVQAISLMPRPYDIDFPLFKSIKVSAYELSRILVLNNWEIRDVRSELQKENGIINYSIVPNKNELEEMCDCLGLDISHNGLVKIRVYGRLLDRSKKTFSLRITPMVVFQEMKSSSICRIFSYIVSSSESPNLFEDWESSAQLRFLQFYYSNKVADFWFNRISHIISFSEDLPYSYRNLSFLFPKQYTIPIEKMCRNFIKLPQDMRNEAKCSNYFVLRERDPKSVYNTIDPISINARLYEPFVDMYHQKEIRCRNLVLEKGKKVFQDSKYKGILNRLNEGLSFQDLVERLRDCINDYDVKQKVSDFIDKSIDAGIIVPIIQRDGDMIFRAYRHGEDVLFGQREELMYCSMLSQFSKFSGGKNSITRMETEKLIVLFTKIGLKKKVLYPYTSNFSADPLDEHGQPMKILRIKPYLKGPVSVVGKAVQHQRYRYVPYITNERKSMWLTWVLLQNGSLRLSGEKTKYIIGMQGSEKTDDIALLTEEERDFVQNFAELTGRISNPNCNTGVNFDDLDWTKVSCTLTISDTVTAVAAEMEIFYNDYDITNLLSFTEDKNADRSNIRFFASSHAFECVHSALMKIESFENRRGQSLISSVVFQSNLEQRMWKGFFSEELENRTDEENIFLKAVFFEEKVWSNLLGCIVNALYILFLRRFSEHYRTKQVRGKKKMAAINRMKNSQIALEEMRKIQTNNALCAKVLFEIYDAISHLLEYVDDVGCDSDVILDKLKEAIEKTDIIATKIKENVCDILGERGKLNDIVVFNYAIHINLDACPPEKIEKAQDFIEKAYKKEIAKIKKEKQYANSKGLPTPNLRLNELPQNYKPVPEQDFFTPGIWYVACGPKIERQVASFAMNVFYGLYQNNIDCRVTVFDRLRYETSIMSNTSKSIEYHCNQFNALMEIFKKDVLFPSEGKNHPSLIHVDCSLQREKSNVAQEFMKSGSFAPSNNFSKEYIALSKNEYYITEYKCTKERVVMEMEKVDFGIITILPEELEAIKSVFCLKKLPHRFGERIFYSGTIQAKKDSPIRKVICAQTINQGEASVISAYYDMKEHYSPQIVFLIGIAGGIAKEKGNEENITRPEPDLCDVIIARSVINYETRKETENTEEHRGEIYNIAAPIAAIVNDFIANLKDGAVSAVDGSKNTSSKVLFEAIGSGNAVIANKLSSIVEWLKKVNSKVSAVEMEALGISSAFYESFNDSNNAKGVKGLLVVRGISDLADEDKEKCKVYRKFAAQNAAVVSKKLMISFPSFE